MATLATRAKNPENKRSRPKIPSCRSIDEIPRTRSGSGKSDRARNASYQAAGMANTARG